jgi:hypothetical protein
LIIKSFSKSPESQIVPITHSLYLFFWHSKHYHCSIVRKPAVGSAWPLLLSFDYLYKHQKDP